MLADYLIGRVGDAPAKEAKLPLIKELEVWHPCSPDATAKTQQQHCHGYLKCVFFAAKKMLCSKTEVEQVIPRCHRNMLLLLPQSCVN